MKKSALVLGILVVGLGLGLMTLRSPWANRLRADEADDSICVVTHVDVIPPSTSAGRSLIRDFATRSKMDPGAWRIEVFEDLARPNHSTLVEVWKDRKAYDDHLATDHVRAYRAQLQPMLGSPFDERLHRQVR